MKSALLILPIVLLSTIAHAAEPVSLRVLSYNIHHGEGIDGKLDLQRIAEVIRSVNPDLVALQEVDQKVERSLRINQPAELGRLTNMNVAFGSNIELQGGFYGNAILSKFPIAKGHHQSLPNINDGEQRGVLIADISVPELATPLRLLATHLDHRRDHEERVQSAEVINKLVDADRRPALLMGDFNDAIGSETLTRLETVWKRTNENEMPTIPVGKPRRQIDFIMFYPAERWLVTETRVLDEAVASDHRPILSVFKLHAETRLP